jgi:hypothetical protein
VHEVPFLFLEDPFEFYALLCGLVEGWRKMIARAFSGFCAACDHYPLLQWFPCPVSQYAGGEYEARYHEYKTVQRNSITVVKPEQKAAKEKS